MFNSWIRIQNALYKLRRRTGTNLKFCASCGTSVEAQESNQPVRDSSNKVSENKNLTSTQIAGGLLTGVAAIAVTAWFNNGTPTSTSASSAAGNAKSESSSQVDYVALLNRHAISLLHDQNGMLCDRLFDEKLKNITYGSLSSGGSTRFPAIKAQYDYACVNPVTGDVERETTFWVVFGYDELGGKYRCFKSAKQSVVENIAAGCHFQSVEEWAEEVMADN